MLLLLVAGAIASTVTLRVPASLVYPATVVWGLIAVAVRQLPGALLPGVTAALMAALVTVAAFRTLSAREGVTRP